MCTLLCEETYSISACERSLTNTTISNNRNFYNAIALHQQDSGKERQCGCVQKVFVFYGSRFSTAVAAAICSVLVLSFLFAFSPFHF